MKRPFVILCVLVCFAFPAAQAEDTTKIQPEPVTLQQPALRFICKATTLADCPLRKVMVAQGSCSTCRANAINYGYTEEEICLNQGGSAEFCHSLFHANVCFYMTYYCGGSCPAQVIESLCQNH